MKPISSILVTVALGLMISACPNPASDDTQKETITLLNIPGVTAPVWGESPSTASIDTAQYTGTIAWNPPDSPFAANTVYTATITLRAKEDWTLSGVEANSFVVAGATTTNPADSGVVTAQFPQTAGEQAPRRITEAEVPDPVLRSLFESATGKPFAEITTADLLTLTELDASIYSEAAGGLTNITGVELCSELLVLNLDGNSELNQIAPIAGLGKLETLALQGCPVADYSLIGNMTSLIMLAISPESISSLTWLTPTNLPNLTGIGLHSHYDLGYSESLIDILDDFSWKKFWIGLPLSVPQFDELFARVLEPNISTLKSFGLYNASQLDNTSIDRVSDFIHLRSLTIWNSAIDNLDFLTGFTDFKNLDLRGNTGLTDLSPIRTLHENGGLAVDDDWLPYVNLESLGMDLTPGSPNRAIIDYLIENGIPVLWEEGNTVDAL